MFTPTRRTFLQCLSASAAMGGVADPIRYQATPEAIQVVKFSNRRTIVMQSVPSRRPSCLVLKSDGRFLYAANEIADYQGIPTGSIESYSVQPGTGRLSLINRAPLSLSATLPKHFALSPDGHHMVVAAYGGGIYNVLSVGLNGELGTLTQALKEIGQGLHPLKQTTAHPHSVVFHPSGKFVVGTDTGADRINVFAFDAGRLTRLHKISTPPGSGPAKLSVSADGGTLKVWHELCPLVTRYNFHPSGQLSL